MEEKKASLYLLLSFILNFCLTFTIIWTLGILLYLNMRLDDVSMKCSGPLKSNAAVVDKTGTLQPGDQVVKTEKNIDIEVNDNGFVNNSFRVTTNDEVAITLRNTGTKPHSFKIDDLGVDSTIVEAGGFKMFTIGSLPNRNAVYNFYSNVPSDELSVFSGELTVAAQ